MPSTELRAFHGDPAVKAKYIARVERHMAADELVRGVGWDNGKGCAVGCTLEAYEHSRYPIELGIPEWLARVEDTLFEGMFVGRAMTWPRDFLAAIPEGSDLDQVKGPFLVVVLRSTLVNFDHEKNPAVLAAVNGAITLWERSDVGSEEWETARSAVWSAAESAARSAARSAAWSAAYDSFAAALLDIIRGLSPTA